MRIWHFLSKDESVLVGAKNSPIPNLPIIDNLESCGREMLLNALWGGAHGTHCCRIEIGEKEIGETVWQPRKVLAMADVSNELLSFTCDLSLRILEEYGIDDTRMRDVILAKKRWVDGLILDKEMKAMTRNILDMVDVAPHSAAYTALWGVSWAMACANTERSIVFEVGGVARGMAGVSAWFETDPTKKISASASAWKQINEEITNRILAKYEVLRT